MYRLVLMSRDEDVWESKRTDWWRVESSAKELIGFVVEESRSIMKSRKSVGDISEPCGTPELIGNFLERFR